MEQISQLSEEDWNKLKEIGVLPTFDLIFGRTIRAEAGWYKKVLVVRRKISPYVGWALPGLRQYKDEGFRDTLKRVALDEIGLKVNPRQGIIVNQADGRFQERQDISTAYFFHLTSEDESKIILNQDHFKSHKFLYLNNTSDIPRNMGSIYRSHLTAYLEH